MKSAGKAVFDLSSVPGAGMMNDKIDIDIYSALVPVSYKATGQTLYIIVSDWPLDFLPWVYVSLQY